MSAGRPKGSTTENAVQRRVSIIESATSVFAERGFEGASTRALADKASVNIGMLAYYFGDKKGLYNAVLDHLYGQLVNLSLPDLRGMAPEIRVRAVVRYLYRFALKNRDVVRILLRHVNKEGRLPEFVRQKWSAPTFMKIVELEQVLDIGSLHDKRLSLLSLNHLLARYAVTTPDDWKGLLGGESNTDLVEEHLGDVAVKLLL